ncbi:DNA cytosine methyltransferase [Brucella sp. HL-2]|nr:DNA cytosine methyltransferase [Brucella sp. HL-2]MCV9910225.1 DNA cytosine methyltransferase [Brucella sp. HL-2]
MQAHPIIIDSFAGGGGASTGIEMALGRSPDIAINHDASALALHEANHPNTLHLSQNVYKIDPLDYLRRAHVGLAWFSPDCKHFSKAKGGKPVERNIRDLAWIIPGWIERIQKSGGRVDVAILENVEEFRDWGPLMDTPEGQRPDPERKGEDWQRWCRKLKRLGAKIEWREIRACDYGAPTIRKRLFVIMRFDGKPIVWPTPTHAPLHISSDGIVTKWAKGHGLSLKDLRNMQPYKVAADIIDWSQPCPSIFDTAAQIKQEHGLRAQRPLAPNSLARVARGMKRYVLDTERPFLVNLTHGGRLEDLDQPLKTVTGAHRGEKALLSPSIVKFNTGATGHDMREPLATVTANSFVKRPGGAAPLGLIAPVLTAAQHGGSNRPATSPLNTVTASRKDQNSLMTAFVARQFGTSTGHGIIEPTHTVMPDGQGKSQLIAAFLAQHNTDTKRVGGVHPGRSVETPISTVTQTGSHQNVVAPCLVKYYGAVQDQSVEEPLHTITAKPRFGHLQGSLSVPPFTEAQADRARQVADFMRSYGFWDDREFVTLEINGNTYVVVDIGMRMLTPRELYLAQGFPADYQIERGAAGQSFSKSVQISCCGNSVSPPVACALVSANCGQLIEQKEAA